MRQLAIIYCFLMAAAPFSLSGNLDPQTLLNGSATAVKSALGSPDGTIEMPDKTLYVYRRGTFTIKDDRVTKVWWMTDEELALREEYRANQHKMWQEREKDLERMLLERGTIERDRKLSDPQFMAVSLENQIEYWRSFQKKYPNVSIEPNFSNLKQRYMDQLDQERYDKRIAELTERAAKAHERVADAEERAADAKERADTQPYFNVGTYTPQPILYPTRPSVFFGPSSQQPILNGNIRSGNWSFSSGSNGIQIFRY